MGQSNIQRRAKAPARRPKRPAGRVGRPAAPPGKTGDMIRLRGLLALEPASVRWLYHLACLMAAQSRHDDTAAWSLRLLAVDAAHVAALSPLSHALCGQGKAAEALAAGRRFLVHSPADAGTWSSLAFALPALQRTEEGVTAGKRTMTLDPRRLDTLSNLGAMLGTLKRFDEGMTCLRRALEADPDHSGSLMNMASLFFSRGQGDGAIPLCRRVIAGQPANASAYANLATSLLDLGRTREAIVMYRQAATLEPDLTNAHLFAGMAYLRLGGFAQGWDLYEWRWRKGGPCFATCNYPQPLWDGGDLNGKTILVHSEQGLGDTLQFVRYVPLLARRAKVVLAVQSALVGLMSSLAGDITVIGEGEPLPLFDVRCPLMSLPRLFATTRHTIPAAGPYLAADPARLAGWRSRLGSGRPRIGLAWSGNPRHGGDRRRSLPLPKLLALIWNSDADWHAVQKDLRPEDRRLLAAAPGLAWHGDELADFTDTAALIAAMDLVISVDTSVAHMAGALAVPTWLMLPYAPDWRWLEDCDDSPWYRSLRLFRQARPDDWDGVIAQIAAHLAVFSSSAAPPGNWDSADAPPIRV